MALNGLEAAKVQEAYQTSQDEAGGWFLLKYTARDEVDLLGKGNGGFSDASEALAEYPDKSPVYAFLLYRRRKLLIKYVPEGTSRLLQARTVVHFQTVQDAFAHDAILNASSPTDLNEASLSACCSLHTSLKSSTSSANRRSLDGISESAEETSTLRAGVLGSKVLSTSGASDVDRQVQSDEVSISKAQSEREALNKSLPELPLPAYAASSRSTNHSPSPGPSPFSANDDADTSYDGSTHQRYPSDLASATTGDSRAESRAESLRKKPETVPKPRTSTTDLLRSGFDRLKPKTKLFARPVNDQSSKRPNSAGQGRQRLPQGLRIRRGDSDRPKTAKSQKSVVRPESPPRIDYKASIPDLNEMPPPPSDSEMGFYTIPRKVVPQPSNHVADLLQESPPDRPTNDSSVTVTLQSQVADDNESTLSFLSPEKQRLMKALQLRKKQRLAQAQSEEKSVDNILITARVDSRSPPAQQAKIDSAVAISPGVEATNARRGGSSFASMTGSEEKKVASRRKDIEIEKRADPAPESSIKPTRVEESTERQRNDNRTLGRKPDLANGFGPLTMNPPSPLVPPPKSERRRFSTTPIKTTFSDDGASDSDDSLFAELATARVEEATPVSLAQSVTHSSPSKNENANDDRTPTPSVAAIVIRPGSRQTNSRQSSISGPVTRTQQIAEQRKVSPLVVGINSSGASAMKKPNVSSEIHKRIQRLAETTSRESLATSPPPGVSSPREKSPFYHRDRRPSNADSHTSFGGFLRSGSRASSPGRGDNRAKTSGSEYAASFRARHQPNEERRRHEAVSITAHIVRDPPTGSGSVANGISQDFNKSKVVIEHQPADGKTTLQNGKKDRRGSLSSRPGSRESTLTAITRQSFEAGWKRLGRGRTDSDSTAVPQGRSVSKTSQDRASEYREKEKTQSKAARIFKRVSGLSKKSAGTEGVDGVRDDDIVREPLSPNGSMPHSKIILGDLNVQLPDTLLWKWRWIEIDVFGNVVLSSSKSNEFSISRGVAKKYHLSDFEAPHIPSIDRQEIPNSIVLDLVNGGALQIACEDPVAQRQIYDRLLDTHKVWSSPRNRKAAKT